MCIGLFYGAIIVKGMWYFTLTNFLISRCVSLFSEDMQFSDGKYFKEIKYLFLCGLLTNYKLVKEVKFTIKAHVNMQLSQCTTV